MDIPTKCLCSSQGIHVAELKILAPLKKIYQIWEKKFAPRRERPFPWCVCYIVNGDIFLPSVFEGRTRERQKTAPALRKNEEEANFT